MIFHSIDYLLFFVAVLLVYWRLPLRGQNLFLLAASYFFYGYIHPWYCILIFATTCIDYGCARGMAANPQKKKRFVTISIVSNFSILCAFKYFNFFAENIVALLNGLGLNVSEVTINVLLPVGISFYTFQSASYVVDVYRGKTHARKNFFNYALFVSFFPQLVAGPIERASNLLERLEKPRTANLDRIRTGLFLMIWGLFKKVVIADNVAVICNKALSLDDPSFPVIWGGVFAFCIQIYADFSAYTDIARGTARTLGIEIRHNFNHPYLARNPSEFWRRWHISLSTWFRDYVYIPLGGNRRGEGRILFNLMATFVLSGLWHGANWNFIIWGAYHGMLLIIWRLLSRARPSLETSTSLPLRIVQIFAMLILTNIGWLLFREQNPAYLWQYLTTNPFGADIWEWRTGLYFFMFSLVYSLPLWIHAWTDQWCTRPEKWSEREAIWKWTVLQAIVAAILFLGILLLRSEVGADFIYFQF